MLKNVSEVLSESGVKSPSCSTRLSPTRCLEELSFPSSAPADGAAGTLLSRPWTATASPAPSLGLALLTGTGDVPTGPWGSEWRGDCMLQSGSCFPGKADHALGFLHFSPDVLNQGGGHIWPVMVQPCDVAENSYFSLRK